ncbi:putative oxidoreductase [Helianthus anomalus]
MTGWEEYSIINMPETLFKIQDTDVSLSYYTGILEEAKRVLHVCYLLLKAGSIRVMFYTISKYFECIVLYIVNSIRLGFDLVLRILCILYIVTNSEE